MKRDTDYPFFVQQPMIEYDVTLEDILVKVVNDAFVPLAPDVKGVDVTIGEDGKGVSVKAT